MHPTQADGGKDEQKDTDGDEKGESISPLGGLGKQPPDAPNKTYDSHDNQTI